MPSCARSPRLHRRAVAPLVVSAFLAFVVAAVGVSGAERSAPSSIPDSAFGPVVLFPTASAPTQSTGPVTQRYLGVDDIHDPWIASGPAESALPPIPGTDPVILPTATPKATTPRAQTSSTAMSTSHRISGAASYYCRSGSSPCTAGYPDGARFNAYAAAGPRLRAALGPNWRGKVILVDGYAVTLIDWCQCYEGQSNEKLLDLYYDVFARTGSSVTIRW